ncbi:MAG: pilus assembly protein HicB [Hydrogenophilales bacterium 28-61-23]|nr:MAG: pilus assembly protein HicB [Hydrogenophilales bacterium 28-61-23]
MKAKHAKTLRAIFTKPTPLASIVFADIETLVVALGGEVREGAGSRVELEIDGVRVFPHRLHPGKETPKYMIEEIRGWLAGLGRNPNEHPDLQGLYRPH